MVAVRQRRGDRTDRRSPTESTVRRNLRKAGIDTAPRVLEVKDIEEIGQLSEQGLSIREIEKVVGWTRGSAMKGIRLHRTERPSR